jgi:hypothetical protein
VIVAAGLLVLLGLGLFVGGLLTGVTVLYWGCVAACVVAAALLVAARRQMTATQARRTTVDTARRAGEEPPVAGGTPSVPGPDGAATTGASADGPAGASAAEEAADGPLAASSASPPVSDELPDPPVEEVEVTDLLLVVDLKDEVLVVDEHPRYHLAGCAHVAGRTTIPLPLDEARTDGFTPCAVCAPDRNLAERVRAHRHALGS